LGEFLGEIPPKPPQTSQLGETGDPIQAQKNQKQTHMKDQRKLAGGFNYFCIFTPEPCFSQKTKDPIWFDKYLYILVLSNG